MLIEKIAPEKASGVQSWIILSPKRVKRSRGWAECGTNRNETTTLLAKTGIDTLAGYGRGGVRDAAMVKSLSAEDKFSEQLSIISAHSLHVRFAFPICPPSKLFFSFNW